MANQNGTIDVLLIGGDHDGKRVEVARHMRHVRMGYTESMQWNSLSVALPESRPIHYVDYEIIELSYSVWVAVHPQIARSPDMWAHVLQLLVSKYPAPVIRY